MGANNLQIVVSRELTIGRKLASSCVLSSNWLHAVVLVYLVGSGDALVVASQSKKSYRPSVEVGVT